ncbi:MAG: 4Fe-4S ferredoxin, partial [Desulfobacterales bacterium]|nr:4Fe-4S ferredoxin [Desulfobacterales bacterium]
MATATCPVKTTLDYLLDRIESGVLADPKGRRISEQILLLMEEISKGEAGDDHLTAIEALLEEFGSGDEIPAVNRETRDMVRQALDTHREVFISHIESRNCATH